MPATGPRNADVMIVGEAYGADEVTSDKPFVGTSGRELDRMLAEAGLDRELCRVTNVVNKRPPGNKIDQWFLTKTKAAEQGVSELHGRYPLEPVRQGIERLWAEINEVQPNVVVALGETALWALTGKQGITKWRGSSLDAGVKVLPTYHPAAILRQWHWRPIAVQDLRRARTESATPAMPELDWKFLINPSLEKLKAWLADVQGPVAVDLETIEGTIASIAIARNTHEAMAIQFIDMTRGAYWPKEQELEVIKTLREALTRPTVHVVGQNFIYDMQYMARWWGFVPPLAWDTMLAQHVLFPGTPKSLDYLSSLYCKVHRYWKDDSKDWSTKKHGAQELLEYNCEDAIRTLEVANAQKGAIRATGLQEQCDFLHDLVPPVLRMMFRGIKIDNRRRHKMRRELTTNRDECLRRIQAITGRTINPRSNPQLKALFYNELGMKPVKNRKTGSDATDNYALEKLGKREPLVQPLCGLIKEYRGLANMVGDAEKGTGFLSRPLDHDGRIRCEFKIAGTETFRFASAENAFGSGVNLQNITTGDKAEYLPNLRKLFVPDEGMVLFDADLERADLAVVIWEAGDDELKMVIREGADIHEETAKAIGFFRDMAKRFIHGTNYGATARTMAATCGITVKEAEAAQRRWFEAHPGIKGWHLRTERNLRETRSVSNAFGFRRVYFDRVDPSTLKEALAWVPQSTVAITTNYGLLNIEEKLPEVMALLQVHDSIVGQFPKALKDDMVGKIKEAMSVPVPYEDPLVMGISVHLSETSWGDAK